MPTRLPQLFDILSLVKGIFDLVSAIKDDVGKLAIETTPGQIASNTHTTYELVSDPSVGLAAIKAAIVSVASDLALDRAAILAAIALTQQTGHDVTLPAIPPAGYGGGGGGASAADVWNYVDAVTGHSALQDLSLTTETLQAISSEAMIAARGATYFYLLGAWQNFSSTGGPTRIPTPDPANILTTDTLLTWIAREEPTIAWSRGFYGGDAVGGDDPSGHWTWICRLDPGQWQALKETVFPALASAMAGVWPGLAHVTLGPPAAIAVGATIAGPMDGVIVNITTVPPGKAKYDFDDIHSWRFIGALTFVDDNGEAEFPTNLGFTDAVYCPRSMHRAASCKVRATQGLAGTVTPWLRA